MFVSVSPVTASAQHLALVAFTERQAWGTAYGGRLALSFDTDRAAVQRSAERAVVDALDPAVVEERLWSGAANVELAGPRRTDVALPGSLFSETSVSEAVAARADGPAAPVLASAGVAPASSPVSSSGDTPAGALPANVAKSADAATGAPSSSAEVSRGASAASRAAPRALVPGGVPADTGGAAPWDRYQWRPHFLEQLVAAALGSQRNPEAALESARSRARLSGLLPVLAVRAGRNSDRSLRFAPTDADPDRWQLTGGTDLRLEAQASWDLDRVAFAPEEVALQRLQAQQLATERLLAKQVLSLAFRWQRALVNVAASGADVETSDLAELWLERSNSEAELDVLTRGWFSKHLAQAWSDAGADRRLRGR